MANCWTIQRCDEKQCPAYGNETQECWLVPDTLCHNSAQDTFIQKMELCLECAVFDPASSMANWQGTLQAVKEQFRTFRSLVDERNTTLEQTSLDMAIGLSEVCDGLARIADGDPGVRISEDSSIELISRLKEVVNSTAESLGTMVEQFHEMAICLAEHFDVLHRVMQGDMSARIAGATENELLVALKDTTNDAIETLRLREQELVAANEQLQMRENELQTQREELVRERTNLRESRDRFERIAVSVSDLIYEWDVFTDRLEWLGDINANLGYAPDTIPPTIEGWLALIHPDDHKRIADAVEHHRRSPDPINVTYRIRHKDGTWRHWEDRGTTILGDTGDPIRVIGACSDVTERHRLQNKLVETSRLAGMAEVATGVLHNVGNVLNSVNVSSQLVADKLRNSHVTGLARANALIEQHTDDLATFITHDAKGRLLPEYLRGLSKQLHGERDFVLEELGGLMQNIEHIKEIVSMQQSFAKVAGVVERVDLADIVESALKVNDAGLLRHRVVVERAYEAMEPITTDKHKVVQILVNLISNAKYAVSDSGRDEKRLTIRIASSGEDRVRIEVEDNGVGIARKNLGRIFQHGMTTKKHGHGFGLHSSALAARELGGTLSVHSDGPGQGAVFILELPLENSNNSSPVSKERLGPPAAQLAC